MIEAFLQFVSALAKPLYELFTHITSGKDDPEEEKQIAMRIIRAAKDQQARKEIIERNG